MKKTYLFLALFIANTAIFAQPLRVAIEGAYPPFSETTASGEVVGFDIDIAHALCSQIQKECRLIKQDWDGMIPGLLARKYDVIIASMSITAERKKKINFTKKYYASPASFITKNTNNRSINNYHLKDKSVAVQRGTIMDKFVTDNYNGILNIKRYGSQDEANLDLVAGRVDFGFMEITTAEDFISTKSGNSFVIVGPKFSDEKWFGEGIGIGLRKDDNQLRNQLNNAILAIRSNGVYKKINDKYFNYDVYGQ